MDGITTIEVPVKGCVSVTVCADGLPAATASIDELPDHWWVSRVLVQPSYRGKGFGSKCLSRAIELVRLQNDKQIIVAPGGYGTPLEDLRKFYAKHGFEGKEEMRRVG
jgi:GNAT superfamily N-acetyltransferase